MARLTREKILAPTKQGSSAQFVDLKVTAQKPRLTHRLRFIGFPMEYWEFRAKKRENGDPKGEWVDVPFIDEHLYDGTRYTRNGWFGAEEVAKRGVCPWAQMGYQPGKKYAIVVIQRGEDGEADTVRVLNRGKQLFADCLMDWETEAEADGEEVTEIGGEVAYDFELVVKYNTSNENQPTYRLKALGKPQKISDEDIELLRAAYEPTAEELEAIYAEDPDLKNYPIWYTYGANLNRIYAPTPVREENAEKTPAETRVTKKADMNLTDDEDEEEATPAAKTVSTKKTVAAKPATRGNVFDELGDDDEDEDEEEGDLPAF